MEEVWKDIEGFEGWYQVSNLGRVRSLKRKNDCNNNVDFLYLVPIKNWAGYCRVGLYRNKKRKLFSVHRLVARAFLPNPCNKQQINHLNGDRSDNRACNLSWCSGSENVKHSYEKLGRRPPRLGLCGKDCPGVKLVLQIKDGVVVAKFYGCNEAERQTGINRKLISRVCRNGRKHAGGYCWRYEDENY